MKVTGGRSARRSRIESDIILGYGRNTCFDDMSNPKFEVCKTMKQLTFPLSRNGQE